MTSIQGKKQGDDERSGFGRAVILPSVSGKSKSNSLFWLFLTVLVAMGGCKNNDVVVTANGDFPVNESFATELVGMGIPTDVAQFFAAARMETKTPNDTTCVYLQTFPNGATREITLTVSPNRKYSPTPEEIANTAPGSIPIFGFLFTSSDQAANASE